jgi:hypothetical protein
MGVVKVHYHKGIETIAYLLSGECIVFYGDALEHPPRRMPETKSSFRRTSLTLRAIRVVHLAHG